MARQIDVTAIDRGRLNRKTLMGNLFIAVVCIAAILALYLGSFLSVNLSLVMDNQLLSTVMESMAPPESAKSGNGIDRLSANTGIDFGAIDEIPEADRTVRLNISLTSKLLVGSVAEDDRAIVKGLLIEQIGNLSKQLVPLVKVVAKVAVNVIALKAVDEVKNILKEQGVAVEQLEAELAARGIVVKEVIEDTTKAVEKLFEENPNTEEIKTELTGVIDKIMSGESEETRQEIIDGFSEVYDQIVEMGTDENGKFDAANLMQLLTNVVGGQNQGKEVKAAGDAIRLSSEEPGVDDALLTALMDNIDESTASTVGLIAKILAVVVIVVTASWAYVLLKVILKSLFAKNKTVHIGVAGFFGMICFILLVILPAIAFAVLPSVLPGALPSGLKVATMSAAFLVSFICSWVLIVFSFFYGGNRKEYKALKRAGMLR